MSDSDDEVPSLSGMQQQLGALRVSGAQRRPAAQDDSSLPVATATVVTQQAREGSRRSGAAKPVAPSFKRGFFDSPKPKARPRKKEVEEEMPVLRGSNAGPSGKQIPDFMRVDQSEAEQQMSQLKEGLVSALKPSEDMVQGIMKQPELLSGFDDPEVMAAVEEIAKNPQAIKKYQHNAKVQQFYSAMGMFVGNRLESMDAPGSGKP
mmetsp:Transcript_26167/g.46539  ORF Transcript_26167/g.46539 Transcript_26167/m.46539 type:complete len:206 (-) Transcript_26167:83-700(-)